MAVSLRLSIKPLDLILLCVSWGDICHGWSAAGVGLVARAGGIMSLSFTGR